MTDLAGETEAASGISAAVRARAARIRLVGFDVDGTLTDGRLWFDGQGNESKAFHVHDGLGLRLLEDNGIPVALVTARDSASARARARDLRLSHAFTDVRNKVACLSALVAQLGIGWDEVAYMGDDLHDLALFPRVGLAVAPANAHPWVRGHAHWVTALRGGEGAARALCDLVLDARGLRDAVLVRFGAGTSGATHAGEPGR
jgi:3-deoxy-D-manno-octulosonate 8-phosphate phosphatase (KDO 8-P phosphatase)